MATSPRNKRGPSVLVSNDCDTYCPYVIISHVLTQYAGHRCTRIVLQGRTTETGASLTDRNKTHLGRQRVAICL